MPNATYEIMCDWEQTGDFSGTYDDITADVKSIHFSRGKSDELGKAEVGQCSITLKNADGKYTPSNSGSDLYGTLLPKRPLRIRATYDAVTYNLFYGFMEEIIPHPHSREQDCIITAVDGLDFFSRHDLGTILIKDQKTGYLHKNILYDAGWEGSTSTNGLVFYTPLWHYDLNTSPFISKDSYRHSCTVTGALWRPNGREFDGVNDNINCGASAALKLTGNMTIEAWGKLSAATFPYGATNWHVMLSGGGSTDGWYLRLVGDSGKPVFNSFGPGLATSTCGTALTNNTWFHLAAVNTSGAITFYIDGALKSNDASGNHATIVTQTANLFISRSAQAFDGIFGEARLYNRALTPAEILHNYNATKWFYETNIDDGQDTVPYWYGQSVKSRFAQEEIDDSEQGFSYIGGAGYFRFEDRYHRSTATHQTSQGTFDNTMSYITYNLNPKNVYNIVKVTVTPWELQSIAELWRLEETPSIDIGQTQTWWGNASVSNQSVFVDAWTTPVSTTDYTANSQADGLGTDMTSDISIVTTKFAQTIKLAITNNGAVPAYITLLKARGTYYNPTTTVTRKAEDTTSQTNYQKRTLPFDGKYMSDADHGQDLADYAIGKYKDPRAELSMSIINHDIATLTQILNREISDRITVVNTKLGVNADYFIDYMEHNISLSGLLHTVTYRLADCINEDFWTLDFSHLAEFATSGQTKLGY